jgi:hypothetical protein
MNMTIDPPAPKTRHMTLSENTVVRIRGEQAAYTVRCVTGWGGSDNLTPVRYRLLAWSGVGFREVAAKQIEVVPEAEIPPPSPPMPVRLKNVCLRELPPETARLIRNPETLPGVVAVLEQRKVENWRRRGINGGVNPHLDDYEKLEYLFRQSHCHLCWNNLDNYTYEECPDCGWIKCSCGGCGCNWPGRDNEF